MDINAVPAVFQKLQSGECISVTDLNCTQDGFFVVYKSLAEILARKEIFDLQNEVLRLKAILIEHHITDI